MELKVVVNTDLDDALFNGWDAWLGSRERSPVLWAEYAKSLDGVIDAEFVIDDNYRRNYTKFVFESEEHYNWFLLKWS